MGLCTRCATLRSEWLAAIEEKFRATPGIGDREVKMTDEKVAAAFQRYLKAHRECKNCTLNDPAFSDESGFFLFI